jgi:hypothetical protein
MNKILLQTLIFPALSVLTGCCGSVDDNLPDLLSRESIKETLIKPGVESDVYDEALIYLNAAKDINKLFCSGEKCNKTNTAGPYANRTSVYYNQSDPNPSSWGMPQASAFADKGALVPCNNEKTGAEMTFFKTGYYLVEILLDTYSKVSEREETNNLYRSPGSRSGRYNPMLSEKDKNEIWGNNRYTKIIYIDKTTKSGDINQVVKILRVY